MPQMADVVEAVKAAGLQVKTMIGGAPVTQSFADEIGADGYAPDAASAVELAKKLGIAKSTPAAGSDRNHQTPRRRRSVGRFLLQGRRTPADSRRSAPGSGRAMYRDGAHTGRFQSSWRDSNNKDDNPRSWPPETPP